MIRESGFLLGIDVGTTSVKSAVFDLEGNLAGSGSSAYPTFHLRPEWAEHDPDLWREGFKRSVQSALSEGNIVADKIVALAVSELAPVVVPVDENGKPLRRAMIWMDRRECQGEMTENPVAKQLWIMENEPSVFRKTHKFLSASGFLYRYLTDRFVTYERLNVPEFLLDKQPESYNPAQQIGNVTHTSAKETGLAEGTQVIMGSYDSMGTALGSGVVRSGRAVDMTGHSTVVMICTDKQVDAPYCWSHIVPGLWLITLSTSTGGGLLRWFEENFLFREDPGQRKENRIYSAMDMEASKVGLGAAGLVMLPYLAGKGQQMRHQISTQQLEELSSVSRLPIQGHTWFECSWRRMLVRFVRISRLSRTWESESTISGPQTQDPRVISGFRSKQMCLEGP